MLKESAPQQYQLEMVTLEELVPQHHLVRKVDAAIDFEFIRDEVAHLYCHDNGRPAIDPVVLFKMMLLGYLFGIPSERRLVQEIQVNVAYRWFLRMGLTDKVPDASTLSQNRIRRFNGTDIFQRIFDNIVEQAITKGMVGGRVLYTDSTHLKANANPLKAKNLPQPVKASAYIDALNAAIDEDRAATGKKPLAPSTTVKMKDTKVSTTDPESGFMHRDNKPKGFFWLDHRTVDGKHGIITDTYTTPGNVHDSQPYIARLERQLSRFKLNPIAVGLDAGYFTAPVCHLTEKIDIIPVIGYRRPNKGQNALQKKHFRYDAKQDVYHCPEGQQLLYKTTSREGYRHYHSSPEVCAQCPRLSDCTQSKNSQKVVTRHVWEGSKERANQMRLTAWGKKVYARRKETVERSFADAKQHHGHRYARFRGLMKVQMQCLLAAAAQNMKKIALLALFYCLLMIYRVQNRGVGYEKMLMALLKHLTDGQEKNIANATFGR
ncbi:transposase for IS1668 [Yersinia enterocolitica]|uniref:Transposase for IS1668 n=1 Tax=Yersinia enterocolitica serotype O:8 / biotype 1B (strain NCTC 13174 / 8081) TaxID=393305 RepID=A1JPQ7_YERE8|nr:IS1182-like element ISYen4 family transposase [Yersinia enterocolitica]AJI81220.1 transposase DDE domain protein [Yersinia enterocolitica]AJI84942.1 transposase DDE domain protein [Yersinia enterocolitica]AJJ24255.1 transposase DDE domain protein [Yersinia enterocolitica]EKA26569.1 transposase for IS1668 [Yersinia enterocolitica subsp. enterocolitica WA-314]ELI8285388.1 IS1182-like element ISYen4 family transposase [Yersinia enterocolitica]